MEAHADDQPEIEIQHPLENHLILDLVLAHVQPMATFKDWKNFRAVCKTWNFLTLSKWRASAVLNLKLGPTLNKNLSLSPGVSMPELLALMENDNSGFSNFAEIPFQKYVLHNSVFHVSNVKKNSLFWTSVGPSIRHLSLHEVDFRTVTNSMTEVMEFLVNQTPNLESISANNVYIEGKPIGQTPRTFKVHPNVKRLCSFNCFAFGFKNFQNLEEVTLSSCGYQEFNYLMDSNLPELGDLINSSIVRLKLQNFRFNSQEFRRLRFTALKHLSVERDRKFIIGSVVLSQFISNHAQTLESIEAFGSLKESVTKMSCWIMVNIPNLTELRAWGNVFSNLNFTRHTPNLKLLHLDLYGFEKQEKMKEDLEADSADKLQIKEFTILRVGLRQAAGLKMHYFQINHELPMCSLEILAAWMPNLKTLKTVLNKNTFPAVCEMWSKLEHLECMFGSSIVDENITGTDLGSSEGVRKKAMVDMENLTTFKLHTECNKSLLSDDCVATGFLRVSELTNLSICVSPEFSHAAEMLIRRGIRNVHLYRNYSSNPLHNNWQCCRDREYRDFIFRPQKPEPEITIQQFCKGFNNCTSFPEGIGNIAHEIYNLYFK